MAPWIPLEAFFQQCMSLQSELCYTCTFLLLNSKAVCFIQNFFYVAPTTGSSTAITVVYYSAASTISLYRPNNKHGIACSISTIPVFSKSAGTCNPKTFHCQRFCQTSLLHPDHLLLSILGTMNLL